MINIKRLKTMQGNEGIAFSCSVCWFELMVADAQNDGNGGDTIITWKKPQHQAKIKAYLDRLLFAQNYEAFNHSDETLRGMGASEKDIELFQEQLYSQSLEQLLDSHLAYLIPLKKKENFFKVLCKERTVFRLQSDKPDEYRQIRTPFDGLVKKWLEQEYGDAILVYNELFASSSSHLCLQVMKECGIT